MIERRETTSRGFRVSYLVAGAGQPLLVMSGMGQHADTWVEDGYVESLAGRFRLVIPDLLGVGETEQPTDPAAYTEPEVALDALAVLDAEGLAEPVPVWGYSRGARLAFMLALEAPGRVSRILAGATAIGIDAGMVAAFHAALVPSMETGDWERYWKDFGVPMRNGAQRERFERSVDTSAAAALLRGAAETAYSFDLKKVDVPVLMYVGGDDLFASLMPADADALGCRLIVLPGLDHGEAYLRRELIEEEAVCFLSASPQ